MSKNIIDQLQASIEEGEAVQKQEWELRKARNDVQYRELKERQAQKQAFDILPIGQDIRNRASRLSQENAEYIRLAKNSAVFLGMEEFKDKVALFPRNIILIGAETGTGKSTTVANFIESYIKQKKRVLIVTNEEYPTDILNRVVFLINNWAYTDHDSITEAQIAECERLYPILMERIEIINDKFNGIGGTTTTLEGIMSICKTLAKKLEDGEPPYDAILIDYIQNIRTSIDVPTLVQWQVLNRLGASLDNYKSQYPAPFILFSQLKSSNNETSDFKDRIEGFKAVMNHATTAIEVKIDRENLRSEFIFRKNRFKGCVGISVFVGFERGRYVKYDKKFMTETRLRNDQKKHESLMGDIWSNKKGD